MICFLDFETTGLDPNAGAEPIELAAVVTDDAFQEMASFETLIAPTAWARWDDAAREMHERSGLLAACIGYGVPYDWAVVGLTSTLAPFAASSPLHLAGNSVHFDRGFLRVYFPAVERLFHHRHLDVSSARMLAERVVPNAPQLGGEKPHRAMADVRRSIQELHHWTAVLRGRP